MLYNFFKVSGASMVSRDVGFPAAKIDNSSAMSVMKTELEIFCVVEGFSLLPHI